MYLRSFGDYILLSFYLGLHFQTVVLLLVKDLVFLTVLGFKAVTNKQKRDIVYSGI